MDSPPTVQRSSVFVFARPALSSSLVALAHVRAALVALALVPALAVAQAAAPVGSEFQVKTYTDSYQYTPGVGPDGAGGFVLVWQSDGSSGTDDSNYSVQGQRFGSEARPQAASFRSIPTQRTGRAVSWWVRTVPGASWSSG